MRYLIRTLVVILATSLLATAPVAASTSLTGGSRSVTTPAAAPLSTAKIVIIVGATHAATQNYRDMADSAYAEAIKYSANVIKVYSPNATWAAVKAAVSGANVVIYLGHGNGWPSPYPADPAFKFMDGFGLNATAGNGDSNTQYYGEPYMAQLGLAPNAVVLLNHLCYSAGNSEPGYPDPTLDVAKQRVDNFGQGFFMGGAQAVIAEALGSINGMIRDLFTTHQSILGLWRGQPNYHGNDITFASFRSPAFTAVMDPETPAGGYYRSIIGNPNLLTDSVLGGATGTTSPPARFVPVGPSRVLDSRYGIGLTGPFMNRAPRTFQVTGFGGVPAGAVAVTGNLTTVGQTSAGYLSLTPAPTYMPSTSTLNVPVGDIRANGVTVALSPSGTLWADFLGASGSTTNVIFDVTGYFAPTSGLSYVAIDPARLLDTRFGNGLSGAFVSATPRSVAIAGRANVPVDALAVTGNITVTRQTGAGYLTVSPTANATPTTSTLNFPAGDDRANNFTIPLGSGGSLAIVFRGAAGASADIIVDITGYFVASNAGALYVPVAPSRLLDSRSRIGLSGPFAAGSGRALAVAGTAGIPSSAVGVTGNVTIVGQTNAGWVNVSPIVNDTPTTSTINFPRGDIRANGFDLRLAAGQLSAVYGAVSGSTTDIVLDITGYFVPSP